MSSEPRRCLFTPQKPEQSGTFQDRTIKQLEVIIDKLYKEFISKYALKRTFSQGEDKIIEWKEHNRKNLPEFYSRKPTRKAIKQKKSRNDNASSTISPLRRKLEKLDIQQKSQRRG